MSRSAHISEERASKALADALDAAMTAPHTGGGGGDAAGRVAGSPHTQRQRIDEWAGTLRSCAAPPELVQDCVEYLRAAAVEGEKAPHRSSSRGSGAAAEHAGAPRDACDEADGGGNGTAQAVTLSTQLDVDRCTLSRMLDSEHALWARWHGTDSLVAATTGSPRGGGQAYPAGAVSAVDAVADVFSEAAAERERWLGWATALREVKTEAAVQRQHRRPHHGAADTGDDDGLDGLLDYLDVPETRWLLEDGPSSVLMAADMFMEPRAYAVDTHGSGGGGGGGAGDASGHVARSSTNDMAAVHAYLTHPDRVDSVPLRSLLTLTLSSHMGDGTRDASPPSSP